MRAGAGDPLAASRATRGRHALASAALALLSVLAVLGLAELALRAAEHAASAPLPEVDASAAPLPPELPAALREKIERMQRAFVMPREWDHIELDPQPGVRRPYRWQGAVHLFNADRMRHAGPFPPRDPERFRVIAVGDSFTYGEGIDARWTWAAQLERALARDFDVEVLNLGVTGSASADVTQVTRRMLPQLEPDVVVYGVCLNDFLDSGQLQPLHYPVPLPAAWKKALERHTRVGRLFSERYGALLRRLGLRPDFYGELAARFDVQRARFARDVAALNAFVTANGRPPVVALVLDGQPRAGGPGQALAQAAESALRDAGAEVVASDDYYGGYDGRDFRVSRWERHPNEEAHAIWADRLARQLRPRADLARFRRARG